MVLWHLVEHSVNIDGRAGEEVGLASGFQGLGGRERDCDEGKGGAEWSFR